jgi:hypothetical protein
MIVWCHISVGKQGIRIDKMSIVNKYNYKRDVLICPLLSAIPVLLPAGSPPSHTHSS